MLLIARRPFLQLADEPELLCVDSGEGPYDFVEATPELLALFGDDRTALLDAEPLPSGGWNVRRADLAANDP